MNNHVSLNLFTDLDWVHWSTETLTFGVEAFQARLTTTAAVSAMYVCYGKRLWFLISSGIGAPKAVVFMTWFQWLLPDAVTQQQQQQHSGTPSSAGAARESQRKIQGFALPQDGTGPLILSCLHCGGRDYRQDGAKTGKRGLRGAKAEKAHPKKKKKKSTWTQLQEEKAFISEMEKHEEQRLKASHVSIYQRRADLRSGPMIKGTCNLGRYQWRRRAEW